MRRTAEVKAKAREGTGSAVDGCARDERRCARDKECWAGREVAERWCFSYFLRALFFAAVGVDATLMDGLIVSLIWVEPPGAWAGV
jgi:hypothetical protein